jgi:hypothetical protein
MCHQISVPAIIRDVFVNINKYILVKYIDWYLESLPC